MSKQTLKTLKLTDFIDREALQEIQESFSAVSNTAVSFRDPQGKLIIEPSRPGNFCQLIRSSESGAKACAASNRAAAKTAGLGPAQARKCHAGLYQYAAPIVLEDKRLGTIVMGDRPKKALTKEQIRKLTEKYGLKEKELADAAASLALWSDKQMRACIRLLSVLGNSITRICYQEHVLRERLGELGTLYDLTGQLSGTRELGETLNGLAKSIVRLTNAKACSLRILNRQTNELEIKARHGFSKGYLKKGPVKLDQSKIDMAALEGEPVYIADMANDPRVMYRQHAKTEGLASGLALGMVCKGQAIGVIHLYTAKKHKFSRFELALLRAEASVAAAAIENARLYNESLQARDMERQLRLAAAVQRQMIPQKAPQRKGLDLAGIYVPCLELAGDFYDYLDLPEGNLGIAVADVAGKGVAASLRMASTRATLRAQVNKVFEISEIMRSVNEAFCLDVDPDDMVTPFVSMFYGVLDTTNRRLTYANAGHEPPLLLRDGKVVHLAEGGPVLGIDLASAYYQDAVDLQAGDVMVICTDGLIEACNFQAEQFGSKRVLKAAKAKVQDSAKHIAKHILWEMRRFTGLTERMDDITIVVAKIT
ncbi:MAG: SpoIIE family protein phosphatase [Actinobacteria bacterium]|nr:SpoIIE family protein phosphatase [Actinomycetota bacterium]